MENVPDETVTVLVVAAGTSGESVIDEVAAAIFVAPCNVTATVLVVKSAACAN